MKHEDNHQDAETVLGGLQEGALQAKATTALRDQVVENVMLVQPLLNAVHHATHASPIERYKTGTFRCQTAPPVTDSSYTY